MSGQGGPSYDGGTMKAVANGTKELGGTLGQMREDLAAKTMTSKAFGNIGDQSNIKGVFDETWNQLMKAVGGASQQVNELGGNVMSSYEEMSSRDRGNAENIEKSGEAD